MTSKSGERGDIMMRLGQNLTREMNRKNYTSVDVARISEMNTITIRSIERGSASPNLMTLYRVAKALDCDVLDLIPASK